MSSELIPNTPGDDADPRGLPITQEITQLRESEQRFTDRHRFNSRGHGTPKIAEADDESTLEEPKGESSKPYDWQTAEPFDDAMVESKSDTVNDTPRHIGVISSKTSIEIPVTVGTRTTDVLARLGTEGRSKKHVIVGEDQ